MKPLSKTQDHPSNNKLIKKFLKEGSHFHHPSFSIDCVIFGFHENQLKILLLKMHHSKKWALPGGFVGKDEDLDDAAHNILKSRTGLTNIFLQQFHVFGSQNREDPKYVNQMLDFYNMNKKNHWLKKRFITAGYYALVDYSRTFPQVDPFSSHCSWINLNEIPAMILDHKIIIDKALLTLRLQLIYQPIGLNLLPKKFTMRDIQSLYETILNKKIEASWK